MAGKLQTTRFELERLLAQFSPELGLKIHVENTIDFGGMTDDTQRLSHWHDTVIHAFAAKRLLKDDVKAAEAVVARIVDEPSRGRVYQSLARSAGETHRDQAFEWLRKAETLVRRPGNETLPVGERLAYIGAAYRKYGAHDDAWRVLKEAAIEVVKADRTDRFEFGKQQVARHLAAYDLPTALKLIEFDPENRPAPVDAKTVTQGIGEARSASERERLQKEYSKIRSRDQQIGDVAVTVADSQPEVAESLLDHLQMQRDEYVARIAHRMARVDVDRAIRIADETPNAIAKGQAIGAIANSLATRDRKQARTLIRRAFDILASAEIPTTKYQQTPLRTAVSLLPTVEAIDAGLVREYVFRTLALRESDTCRPRASELGRTGERELLRLADPLLGAAIARYDKDLAARIAMPPADSTLNLGIDDAPDFLIGAIARIDPARLSFEAVNKADNLQLWSQILPALMLDEDAYWSWLMDRQLGVWEIGSESD